MFKEITSDYAIDQISRDGVFIEYTVSGKPAVDRARTVEEFDKYCKVVKRDLARLKNQDKALKELSKYLHETAMEVSDELMEEYEPYNDGYRDAILTIIGQLIGKDLFTKPSEEQCNK